MDDSPASRPFLVQPWQGGVTGWIVVFGAVIAELAGASVTNRAATAVAVPVLLVPVAVVAGFALVQWRQARVAGAEPANLWHLAGVAAAVFAWVVWPTAPGVLQGASGSAPAACNVLPTTATGQCLARAAAAIDNHNLTWWLTLAVILLAVPFARRSRIAAWATIPIAFAGCALATHFLQALLQAYHAS